jgi:hypothetical protein
VDIGRNPAFQILSQKSFSVCTLAIGEDSNKNIGLKQVPGIGVGQVGGLTNPVHFNLLARFSRDMHNRFGLVTILTLVVAELGVHERCFTAGAAVLTLLDPEQ